MVVAVQGAPQSLRTGAGDGDESRPKSLSSGLVDDGASRLKSLSSGKGGPGPSIPMLCVLSAGGRDMHVLESWRGSFMVVTARC